MSDLADFVRVRRLRVDPATRGIDTGAGRRRVRGLRREELGQLAGLSADWIARLEQGRTKRLSRAAAERLARVLGLDEVEARHLLALCGQPDAPAPAADRLSTTVQRVVAAQGQNPAYAVDPRGDVLFWNAAADRVFGPFDRGCRGASNSLRWMFLSADPTVRARDDAGSPDIILQGGTAGNADGALRLQRHFHDGSYAEQMMTAAENVFPLPDLSIEEAARWCRIGGLLVPFGGLLSIEFRAGETLVVNGATGRYGSAAVQVALAMGAARVVATGRNRAALAELERRFGPRVSPAAMTGSAEQDRATILAVADGPLDCALDILPPQATPAQVATAVGCVRPNGRVSLMGGVGIADGAELALPYRWIMRNNITVRGQWMYPRSAVPRFISMVRGGLIDLAIGEVTSFPLSRIAEAVEHAAANAGPFSGTVLLPGDPG